LSGEQEEGRGERRVIRESKKKGEDGRKGERKRDGERESFATSLDAYTLLCLAVKSAN
jgi:hypothetical protein